jgi:hypothetical protein
MNNGTSQKPIGIIWDPATEGAPVPKVVSKDGQATLNAKGEVINPRNEKRSVTRALPQPAEKSAEQVSFVPYKLEPEALQMW